ncbi:MAG: hypothetical protein D6722_20800 [Bacteroidetes bacterium]|nr:MAG: hypothetical protein D6722_20800 [Bacteroidota bacterium]
MKRNTFSIILPLIFFLIGMLGIGAGPLFAQPADLWDEPDMEAECWAMLPIAEIPDRWEAEAEEMEAYKASAQIAQSATQVAYQELEAERWRLEGTLSDLMLAQQKCAQRLLLSLAEGDLEEEGAGGGQVISELGTELAQLMDATETLHLRIILIEDDLSDMEERATEDGETIELIEEIQTADRAMRALALPAAE